MLFRESYLLLMYVMDALCPCCISQRCRSFQQHIYDLKQYQTYFGHSPKQLKHQKSKNRKVMNGDSHIVTFREESDIEESLPNLRYPESASAASLHSQSHGIFDSPPLMLHDVNTVNHQKKRDRRLSQVSICGIPIAGDNRDIGNECNPSKHRKQSTMLSKFDLDAIHQNGIALSDDDGSDGSYDLHVPSAIIDEAAAKDDLVEFDDSKSEQYDNFADMMIRREMDLLYGQNENGIGNGNDPNPANHGMHGIHINPSNARRGSIGNLAKKRRNSLILSAVDGIKQGIKNMTEKKQQRRESLKEQQFMKSQRDKWKTKTNDDSETDNDEVEYYNESAGTEETDSGDDEREYYNTHSRHGSSVMVERSHQRHQRSRDRLSAVRNSLASIIPNRKNKKKKSQKSGGGEYEAVSQEHSVSFADNGFGNGFGNRFGDDHRGDHHHGNRHDLGTSTDALTDDDASIATYGTAKDCLDDDLESELNAMAAKEMMNNLDSSFLSIDPSVNPSVSAGLTPNRNRFMSMEQEQGQSEETEQSETLSLESISNSEDEESPPLQSIQINTVTAGGFGRGRRGSTTLEAGAVMTGGTGSVQKDRLCVIEEDSQSDSDDDSSCSDLDIRVKIEDDVSCDDINDMMTASML